MATYSTNITINAPIGDIWSVLADFPAISQWVPLIQHSCTLSQQQSGIGAVRRVQIAQQALVETVTVWEPERQLSYTIDGLPPIVGMATNTWRLEPAKNGVIVTLTTDIPTGRNPVRKLAATKALERMSIASTFMTSGLRQELATRRSEVTK